MEYQYGKDILQDALKRGGEKDDLTGIVSDYLPSVKRYVQRVYKDLLCYAPWPWALADPPGVLSIVTKITGTATVTLGSATVTLGATIATSQVGKWFALDANTTPYRISAHTAGTAILTLDTTYKESSATDSSYLIFQDEYALAADCLRPWRAWNRNNPYQKITIISQDEMHKRYPIRTRYYGVNVLLLSLLRGDPPKVRAIPWPEDQDITVEYDYTKKPITDLDFAGGATDTPVFPQFDRHVIADAALVLLMMDKNDGRVGDVGNLVMNKLTMMVENYIGVGESRMYVPRGQGIWR